MYSHFLFDLDGTLVDSGLGVTNSVAYALRKWGLEVPDRTSLNRFVGPPLSWSFQHYHGFSEEDSFQAVKDYREYYSQTGIYEVTVYPGIPELLAALKDRGCHLYVATSKPEDFAIRVLDHIGLSSYFDFIGGATMDETTRTRKADVVRYVLDHAQITDMDTVVMVGDREHDVLGAAEAGLPTIGAVFGYGTRDELLTAGAAHLVDTAMEVLAFAGSDSLLIPPKLKPGDRIAIVSLSSGILGEDFARHELEQGLPRLEAMGLTPVFMPHALKGLSFIKEHPEARAADLKAAFLDDSIQGILCAIGGDDTYRTLPYLLGDPEFVRAVHEHPKLFTGFSDTTINHLMFHRLGLQTYYGPAYLTDIAELADEMLPYTKEAFMTFFEGHPLTEIHSSPVWYEERRDFSAAAVGTERISHSETRGFELLQGCPDFSGVLLGGCLESIYDLLTGARYADEKGVGETYRLFPSDWSGKILFIETSEERPPVELYRTMVEALKKTGLFSQINGVIVGKPQNEMYYEEYRTLLPELIGDPNLPILFNVNFGHAFPRTVLPYGTYAEVHADRQVIHIHSL